MTDPQEEPFKDEVTRLNRNFLSFITKHLAEQPNADLTPTLKSYIENLGKLDEKYSSDSKENHVPTVRQPRAILPINRSIQMVRKKVQVDPAIELLLKSPVTPSVRK